MKTKLQLLAAGQSLDDWIITYSDLHGLWGGVTITVGPSCSYERTEQQRGTEAPDVMRGTLTINQMSSIGRLLLEIKAWEQRTPERMPVPDEIRATLTLRCGDSQSIIWEWHHDLESDNRIVRVRTLLMGLCG